MTLTNELRNAIANMYSYWYDNNEYEWSEKRKISFMKKINSIKYDKPMPSLNKKELEKLSWYWWNNFAGADDLDEYETKTLELLTPWLKKKGFDFV
jgi:hypothetical protein